MWIKDFFKSVDDTLKLSEWLDVISNKWITQSIKDTPWLVIEAWTKATKAASDSIKSIDDTLKFSEWLDVISNKWITQSIKDTPWLVIEAWAKAASDSIKYVDNKIDNAIDVGDKATDVLGEYLEKYSESWIWIKPLRYVAWAIADTVKDPYDTTVESIGNFKEDAWAVIKTIEDIVTEDIPDAYDYVTESIGKIWKMSDDFFQTWIDTIKNFWVGLDYVWAEDNPNKYTEEWKAKISKLDNIVNEYTPLWTDDISGIREDYKDVNVWSYFGQFWELGKVWTDYVLGKEEFTDYIKPTNEIKWLEEFKSARIDWRLWEWDADISRIVHDKLYDLENNVNDATSKIQTQLNNLEWNKNFENYSKYLNQYSIEEQLFKWDKNSVEWQKKIAQNAVKNAKLDPIALKEASVKLQENESYNEIQRLSEQRKKYANEYEDFTKKVFNVWEWQTELEYLQSIKIEKEKEMMSNKLNKINKTVKLAVEESADYKELRAKNPWFATTKEGELLFNKMVDLSLQDSIYAVDLKNQIENVIWYDEGNDLIVMNDYEELLKWFNVRREYWKRVYDEMAELKKQRKYKNIEPDKLMNIADDRVNVLLSEEEKDLLAWIANKQTKLQAIIKAESSVRDFAKWIKGISEWEIMEWIWSALMWAWHIIYATWTAAEAWARKSVDKLSSWVSSAVSDKDLKETERQAEIARQVRSFRYTYDWLMQQAWSAVLYNLNSVPWFILTTAIWNKWAWSLSKWTSTLSKWLGTWALRWLSEVALKAQQITPRWISYITKVAKATESLAVSKAPKLFWTLNTWMSKMAVYGRNVYNTTSKSMNMITESVLTWVASNPVFDRLGKDAASPEQIIFNTWLDIAFDFWFDRAAVVWWAALKKWYQWWSSYFFNHVFKEWTDSAAALDNFIKDYYKKTGLKINRKEWIQLFKEGELAVKNLWIHTQKNYVWRWELYNFISEWLKVADETKIKKFIDSWVWIEIDDIVWKRIDTEDLLYSTHKNMIQEWVSEPNKKIYSQIIDKELDNIKEFVSSKNRTKRIWRKTIMNYDWEWAAETRAVLMKEVEELEKHKGKKTFYKKVDTFMEKLEPAIRKFSNQKEQVVLYNTLTNDKISIDIKDLEKIKWKNFEEIVKDNVIDLSFVDQKIRSEISVWDRVDEKWLYSFTPQELNKRKIEDIMKVTEIKDKIDLLKEELGKAKYVDEWNKVSDKSFNTDKIEKNISRELNKALDWKFAQTTNLSKTNFSKEKINQISSMEAEIFEDAIRIHYWNELIADSPIDLWNKGLSWDDVINKWLDKDTYFSFAYWSPWEKSFEKYKNKIMYLLPWKKLEHNSIIKWLSNKAKDNLTDKTIIKKYIESSSEILQKLEWYWKYKADWYIDIEEAMKYLNIEDTWDTFEQTMLVIKNTFKDLPEEEFKRFDWIQKILQDEVLKWDVVDDNMLKNLAYNYFWNVDEIKKFFNDTVPNKQYESVLSKMLMSDEIVSWLSKTIDSPYASKIRETLKIDYSNRISKYEMAIKLRKQEIKDIEKELKGLWKYKARTPRDEYLKALKADLVKLVKDQKKLIKEWEDGFIKARTILYTNDTNLKRINDYRHKVSRAILLNENIKTKTKLASRYEDLITKKGKKDFIKDEWERLIKKMDDINNKANLWTLDITKEIDEIKKADYYTKSYKDFTIWYLENLSKPDAWLVDINYKKLEENIKNKIDWVFNYESAKENNPIYKEIYDWILRSDINDSNVLYVDNFNKQFGIKQWETLLESYNKKWSKLNKFVDWLYFDDKKLNKILNDSFYSKWKIVTLKEVKEEVNKDLKDMLNNIIGDKKIYANVDWKKTDITNELIDDIIDKWKLRKQLKRIKRLDTGWYLSIVKWKKVSQTNMERR